MRLVFMVISILLLHSCKTEKETKESDLGFDRTLSEILKLDYVQKETPSFQWWLLSDYWDADTLELSRVEYNSAGERDHLVRFVDVSSWICQINYEPSCAEGMTVYDTINVKLKEPYLELDISGRTIGVSEFDYNFKYLILSSDSNKISLKRFQD